MPADVQISPESLRRALQDVARVPRGDQQIAARVVGEVLLAQAEQRTAAVSHALIDARMQPHGATDATAECDGVRPLDVLRHGPRDVRERALVSVLLARHVGALLEREPASVTALLPALDWLEFTGPYAPWSASRVALDDDARARLDRLAASDPISAPSPGAAAAVRALRGLAEPLADDGAGATVRDLPFPVASRDGDAALVTVAGELEGAWRGTLARTLGVLTGWSAVRGAARFVLRHVFSLRRPVTVSLDGGLLRVVGHTELLGRTLRTHDLRFPTAELVEVTRTARYPSLPASVAVVALGLGAFFGARAVVEGAGMVYFPLIGVGIGLLVAGLVFDLLLRAIFPGVRGEARLLLRARNAATVEIASLPIDELERLLTAIDARFGAVKPRISDRVRPAAADLPAPAAPRR